MKYQTNESLGIFINKFGCYLCSILEKVEKHGNGYRISNSDICGIYLTGIRHELISRETFNPDATPKDGCTILDPVELYNQAAMILDLSTRCLSARGEEKDYIPVEDEEEILELFREDHDGSHFVSGTGIKCNPWQGEIEFDPIEGGSLTARYGYIKSKRILTIKDGK